MRYWPIVAYGVLYAVLLIALRLRHGFALGEPLFILAIVGIGFSALAWWATRGVEPRRLTVRHPRAETKALLLLLVLVAVFITWGLPAVRIAAGGGFAREAAVLVAKLLVFVVSPTAILAWRWRYRWRDLADLTSGMAGHWRPLIVMCIAVVLLQLAFGRAPQELGALSVSPPLFAIAIALTFVWLLLEVGLVEEYFFRTLLQSRIAASSGSELLGLVTMALLFGLAHAPGLYLRPELTGEAIGTDPSLLMAVGYSVVVTSVAGLFLGVLWLRTRNLLLVAVVHAANDLLPSTVDYLRSYLSAA